MEMLSRGIRQLLGRVGGPLHSRLVMMPIVVTVLAVRAGLRGACEGLAAFRSPKTAMGQAIYDPEKWGLFSSMDDGSVREGGHA